MHNFSAGPCVLPKVVYEQAAQAVLDFQGSGLSILEISHRSKEFVDLLQEARSLALELLGLDTKKYTALFLQGSASMEFLRVPYNLMKTQAAYIDTGVWSSKAIVQGELQGQVMQIGSSKNSGYSHIPVDLLDSAHMDYVHFTSNNTIYGTQFNTVPKVEAPLVCDMSSDIYSREFPYDQIDLIYAGVQKNIGPAGLSLVLVNQEILGKTGRSIAHMMDYQEHIKAGNLYHTANVFGVYTCLLNLRWLQKQGGVQAMQEVNQEKAFNLYQTLDALDFVKTYADKACRSMMNVVFDFTDSKIASEFDALCDKEGIVNIKGHRTLGGYRASLYNALEPASVQVLVDVLQDLKHKV